MSRASPPISINISSTSSPILVFPETKSSSVHSTPFRILLANIFQSMIKYYVNSEYRKAYDFLSAAGVIHPRSLSLSLIHSCLTEKSINSTNIFINQCICVLRKTKLTPISILKSLVFLHIYLQKAKSIIETDLLPFLAYLLTISSQLEVKGKRSVSVNKMKENIAPILDTSVVIKKEQPSSDVLPLITPYVSFLQKSISMFDMCYCLRKNVFSPLEDGVAWTLLNMLRQMTGITGKLKMDAMVRTFTVDVEWVYAKLYRYVYGEVKRIENDRKLGIGSEGMESLWHLIQELQRQNREISKMHYEGWKRPIYVDQGDECFRFINQIFEEKPTRLQDEGDIKQGDEGDIEQEEVYTLGDIVNWQAHKPIFQICSTPKFGGRYV